jgi:cytochrome c-type biogenesis protein CcmH
MRRIATVLAALVALTVPIASAEAATPRTSLNAVETEVMCVSCGVSLSIADSPQATAERTEIMELIRQGKTKQQILDALVVQYGDRVLASPKDKGFGRAAYLVPIVIVLLALVALAIFLPRWRAANRRSSPGAIAPAGPELTDADAQRVEEDLARYDV